MNEFCEFFTRRYMGRVVGYLVRREARAEDAMDAVANVLSRLATWTVPDKSLYDPNHHGGATFLTWFTAAAKREWAAMMRKNGREVGLDIPQDIRACNETSDGQDEEDEAGRERAKARVEDFMRSLSEQDRIIVEWYFERLRRDEGPNWPGLARILEGTKFEMSEGTIRTRFSRLRVRYRGDELPPGSLVSGEYQPPSYFAGKVP
jgi:DNA-directed RNA polymerase specialized sigma24 family protein